MTPPSEQPASPHSAPSGADEFQVRLHWPDGVPNGRQEASTPAELPPVADLEVPLSELQLSATASGLVSQTALLTTFNTLMRGVHDMVNAMGARMDDLTVSVATGQDAVAERLAQLTSDVGVLTEEVAQLRRRVAMRVRNTPAIDSDDIERIAAVVVARLLEIIEIGDSEPPSSAE